MIHISLFSGLGGFELAAEKMCWKNYVCCETNEFCNTILKYYWPSAYHHKEIKTLTYEKINKELTQRHSKSWRSEDIILTGGFPCQPYSSAGKRLGKEDNRHLWPEMYRVIQEVQPKWIVGENVLGIINWNNGLVFDEVQVDMELEGYEVQSYVLPAAGINAPHIRQRVWFVARKKDVISNNTSNTNNAGFKDRTEQHRGESAPNTEWEGSPVGHNTIQSNDASNTIDNGHKDRLEERGGVHESGKKGRVQQSSRESTTSFNKWLHWPSQSAICCRNDVISFRLDGIAFSKWKNESIKGFGNAVVPELVLLIFKSIEQYEKIK